MNTGGELFPEVKLKPHIPVYVVATVGYPSLAPAVSIGLLCLMLVGWIVLKRFSGDKALDSENISWSTVVSISGAE